jgi:hypothetical protein
MILRLLAFVLFVFALATLAGDAWHAYSSSAPFAVRSAGDWWSATSPSTLNLAQHSLPAITSILPYPASAVLAVLGVIALLPTAFFRQRH